MSTPEAWRKIGALLPLMGSADDAQVGRALDQIDAALADAGLSWAVFGEKVSKLGVTQSSAPDPRRNGAVAGAPTPRGTGGRPPSQWAIDREDVVKLFEYCTTHGAPSDWVEKFTASLHDWVVGQGRAISDRQREILHEKLDQLDL